MFFHHPAPVLVDLRIDQLLEVRLEPFVRPLLIHPHQARIPRYVGGEDRGEAADRGHTRPAVDCLCQAYPETGGGPSGERESVCCARAPISGAPGPINASRWYRGARLVDVTRLAPVPARR